MAEGNVAATTATGAEDGGQPQGFDWSQHLSGEELGYAQNKGFKTPAELAKAYRELESFRGIPAERILALPDAADKPEAWDALYNRLGRPESPDKYDFKFPEGFQTDENMIGWFKGVAHKAGLNPKQAAAFVEEWTGFNAGMAEKMQAEMAERQKVEMTELRSKMGAAQFDERLGAASSLLNKLGVGADELGQFQEVLGHGRTAELFFKITEMLGEDKASPVEADSGMSGNGFTMTIGQATAMKHQIMAELASDPARMALFMQAKGADYEKIERLQKIEVSG